MKCLLYTLTMLPRSRAAGDGDLADPVDVFGAACVDYEEMTPMPQPRTMKDAVAVTSDACQERAENKSPVKI